MSGTQSDAPLFEVVEIEINVRCNRECSYCPNSHENFSPPESHMSHQLFSKLCDELGELKFAGRISFHFYNEPLLRKDLTSLVREVRAKVPMSFIDIYTNGDLLFDPKYIELINAGVDRFYVTRHSYEDFPNRDYQIVQMPDAMTISGRGGLIETAEKSLTIPCYAPSEMLTVCHDGKVILCCEDSERLNVIGNANIRTLEEIWNDKQLIKLRRLLENGQRNVAGGICAGCTSRAHPIRGTAI